MDRLSSGERVPFWPRALARQDAFYRSFRLASEVDFQHHYPIQTYEHFGCVSEIADAVRGV